MAEASREKKNINPGSENRKTGLVIAEIRGKLHIAVDTHIPSYCDTSAQDFLSVKNGDWYNGD